MGLEIHWMEYYAHTFTVIVNCLKKNMGNPAKGVPFLFIFSVVKQKHFFLFEIFKSNSSAKRNSIH